MSQPATRIGDADVPHCSPMTRAIGAPTVFVNGIPWSRQGDKNTEHLKPNPSPPPPCIPHTTVIIKGSVTVYPVKINGGRIGDPVGPECTAVAKGSPNVFCGG
jgi:uncharacterized Zn-binding protein involved in type VI secretion